MSFVTGQASRSGDNDGLIRFRVTPEDCDAVDVDRGRGTEVGKSDLGRATGISREKSVVFQIPPLGPAAYTVLPDVSDGSTAIALTCPVEPVIGSRPNRRPLLTGQTIGLAEREDTEALGRVITAVFAQARGREWLLEAQRPPAENTGFARVPEVEFVTTRVQFPFRIESLECSSTASCGSNVAKNGALPFWIGVPD